MNEPALLLIAHGSRNVEANADLLHMARSLEKRGYAIVEAAFLELAEPTIGEGGRRCVERGAKCVVLVPYFLSAGVHVRRDLVEARNRLSACFPEVEFRQAEPLGRHPLLCDVVADRVGETNPRPSDSPATGDSGPGAADESRSWHPPGQSRSYG
jgi:sirohydrochlorin ferrochelatase